MKSLQVWIYIGLLLVVSFCSVACQPRMVPPVVNKEKEESHSSSTNFVRPTATVYPTLTVSATSSPSPTKTPTITPTAPELSRFVASDLRPGLTAVSYFEDPCDYLQNKWGEDKSKPGTIVVPIMFHSISKPGEAVRDNEYASSAISYEYFENFMNEAKELGFSTITIEDLVLFLEENYRIPERSLLLILDDRRPGVTEYFMPFLEANDWTLTLAWPTTDGTTTSLWEQMEKLAESGRLDVQSHGHDHIYIQDYTPIEEIEEEIYKPIEMIQSHFNTTPQALIWPGGNFTDFSAQLARQAGFKVGFTVYSRGPLMFNWIPLGEPEEAVGDPLLVLPRYWSTAADVALEHAIAIGEEAKQAAQNVKTEELRYLTLYCQPADGE